MHRWRKGRGWVYLWSWDADGCRRWGIKNGMDSQALGKRRRVAKNGVGLKAGTSFRALETRL